MGSARSIQYMKVPEDREVRPYRPSLASARLSRVGLLLLLFLFLRCSLFAGPLIEASSPIGFFTNVATRLLQSELGLDLTNIQVYPANQYTPAVHRLLQVTANLYDATTNRAFAATLQEPYCPSVFRPIFRRISIGTNYLIVIAGYREVVNVDMATATLAPIMVELDSQDPPFSVFPVYGTPFSPIDRDEPMVSGVPLIFGARKGFPNFNEFSMQTQILVSRLLEFQRMPGVSNGPVVQTNQMYVIGISNTFGLEAWNSYITNYPRDLNLVASVTMTAIMTNEMGTTSVLLSNRFLAGNILSIPANSWNGWTTPFAPTSFVLPWGTTNAFPFLSNSTYISQPPGFMPQTHVFSTGDGFYVPQWWLNLNTRVLFILVDTAANRIVDYVNLDRWEPSLDITAKLAEGNTGSINALDYKNPANEWLTNRLGNSTSLDVSTYGVINQIQVGLNGTVDWQSGVQDPYSGLDAESAVDGFRYNLAGLGPIYPRDQGKVFYRSNVFYAPFDPYRPIYIHTSWEVNDPLVHYMVNDLLDLSLGETNRVNFFSQNPPLPNIGQVNDRYRPWGGNPQHADPTTDYQLAIKDPWVSRSDDWDFPTNQSLGIGWVGRVHRGTPWQTIFLKSTNFVQRLANLSQSLIPWVIWTGNDVFKPNPGQPPGLVWDAAATVPTNDWHLVSLFNRWFSTNDLRTLTSPNRATTASFEAMLDGMIVFTNNADGELVMSSNSPQAAIIAQGIIAERLLQSAQVYSDVGDILSVPELSIASLWLAPNGNKITDEAIEILPSQLLPLLRADSIGVLAEPNGVAQVQFSGFDEYAYAMQESSNLVDWVSVATNIPTHGLISYPTSPPPAAPVRYFRSLLLP